MELKVYMDGNNLNPNKIGTFHFFKTLVSESKKVIRLFDINKFEETNKKYCTIGCGDYLDPLNYKFGCNDPIATLWAKFGIELIIIYLKTMQVPNNIIKSKDVENLHYLIDQKILKPYKICDHHHNISSVANKLLKHSTNFDENFKLAEKVISTCLDVGITSLIDEYIKTKPIQDLFVDIQESKIQGLYICRNKDISYNDWITYSKHTTFKNLKALLINNEHFEKKIYFCNDISEYHQNILDIFKEHKIKCDGNCINIHSSHILNSSNNLKDLNTLEDLNVCYEICEIVFSFKNVCKDEIIRLNKIISDYKEYVKYSNILIQGDT